MNSRLHLWGFAREKLSLGRGSGRVTSVCPGPRGGQSHFGDGIWITAQLAASCRVSFWLWLTVQLRPPTCIAYSHQTTGEHSSFSVLSPTAELREESERFKIINKSLSLWLFWDKFSFWIRALNLEFGLIYTALFIHKHTTVQLTTAGLQLVVMNFQHSSWFQK